jgi:hypothetical protein
VGGLSLIARDVALGHFRSKIAHAICSKKKQKKKKKKKSPSPLSSYFTKKKKEKHVE